MGKTVITLLLLMLTAHVSVSQNTLGGAVKKGAADAFLGTFQDIQQQREQQKLIDKQMREQGNPVYHPKELGVPYLGFEAGLSHFRGEHIGLKAALMGFNVFGGVGKEWVFKNHTDKDLFWYAGAGYFFGDTFDGTGEASIDITVGQSPICPDVSIIGSISMGYFFGRSKRFGVKGTLGLGAGNLDRDEPKFIWEYGAGIIIKIFADKNW